MSTDRRFTDKQMAEAVDARKKLRRRGPAREPQTPVQVMRAKAADAERKRQAAARRAETLAKKKGEKK